MATALLFVAALLTAAGVTALLAGNLGGLIALGAAVALCVPASRKPTPHLPWWPVRR